MIVCGVTDIGLLRQENQDTYLIDCDLPGGFVLAAVFDGMGGAAAGSTASRLAAQTFHDCLRARLDGEADDLSALLRACVAAANAAVYERSCAQDECRGMGTTIVAALLQGERAVVCNVGDSRAYRIAGGAIGRVTRDHSVVEDLIAQGKITEEEARSHPNRNLITRALGPDAAVDCDLYELTLDRGEELLLCSDGLVITLTSEQMCAVVTDAPSPAEALARLVDCSRENGAPDNVTAVLIQNL